MKAVICTAYGSPDVLKFIEIDKPVPRKDEILIKIFATAVNSGDVRIRGLDVTGYQKILMKLFVGFSKPRKQILGNVFSGVVESVGENVKKFSAGDEVFGMTGFKFGTYAEYISLPEKSIISKKPANATHEEAAAIIFGGQTAHYFLHKTIKSNFDNLNNSKILIYGATGSVGSSAVQIAKFYNADITTVSSESGNDLLSRLGVEKKIFYDKEDFTKVNEKFDLIFDAVGKISKNKCKGLLNDSGKLITVGGMDVASETITQLEFLAGLFDSGKLDAAIDRIYPFGEIVEAHRYTDTGRKKANVVLKM
ncbi:MAG TPA: NAD(P)-dependent alcohol dehydrogenase [Ignavibacteria bacterium]|nr:NAD(P)-dependent alcohol dehydrogenase [Ignavibacteria bacterium]